MTQAEPTPLPAQLTQVAPALPQAAGSVPPLQVPPRQQPPLQGSTELQAAPQRWVARLHACPDGQSPGPLQPQPPLTQAVPLAAAVQSMQALPPAPQVGAPVPALQVPP